MLQIKNKHTTIDYNTIAREVFWTSCLMLQKFSSSFFFFLGTRLQHHNISTTLSLAN